MQVLSTQKPVNVSYSARRAESSSQSATYEQAQAIVDQVTISPQGRAMNDPVTRAVWQGDQPKTLASGELPLIPQWMGDFNETRKRSEAGVNEAMRQLGIPENTPLTIRGDSFDGTLTVEGDFPNKAELEAIVNSNMALRNVLVATENNARMLRIVAANEKAMAATEANPAGAARYSSWLTSVVRQISGMGFEVHLNGGRLEGLFIGSQGQHLGILENPEAPPA